MKKFIVGSIVLLLCIFGWGPSGMGEQGQRRRESCGSWISTPGAGCGLRLTSSNTSWISTGLNFPVFQMYHNFALDGPFDWVSEQPELRQLYAEALRTADREQQQGVIRQMERHTRDQAYFLFLYNPFKLYAVNKAVAFVPYVTGYLTFAETTVMEQHWSVRK